MFLIAFHRDTADKLKVEGIETNVPRSSSLSHKPFFKDTLDSLMAHRTPADLNENLLNAGHMIDLAGKVCTAPFSFKPLD